MRDHRADRSYFDELIEANEAAVADGRRDAADADLKSDDIELYVDLLQIYRTAAFTLTNASYSRGDSISVVRDHVTELITAETLYRQHQPLTSAGAYTFASHPAQYLQPLQVLSLSLLLGIESGRAELIAATGSQGMDSIYDFLADPSHSVDGVGDKVAWPKPYAGLLEAVRSGSPEPLRNFLETWYNNSRKAPWWGTHLSIESGDRRYSGYWCYEAAAVTKILQIDDSSYRDNEYYPRDLLQPTEGE
jgi:hypothetical protein